MENEPTFYNYSAKKYLKSAITENLKNFNHIFLFSYEVILKGKYPFLQILLTKEMENVLKLPEINISKNMTCEDVVNYANVVLFGWLRQFDFDAFQTNVHFDGFFEFNNNLYLFIDITKCGVEINDIFKTNKLWMTLVDEIVNHKHLCNIPIDNEITDLLTQNDEFCFLLDENNAFYEIPQVTYVCKHENKLNFTYIFGETKDENSPFYRFTNNYFQEYDNAIKLKSNATNTMNTGAKKSNGAKSNGVGLVRFAIFTGLTHYLDTNEDIKILDNYDSYLEDGMTAIKNYNQQTPLSYHLIDADANDYSII